MELDDALYRRLTALTDRGNQLTQDDRIAEAVPVFEEALALLPKPVEQWEAATYVLVAIGDCHFMLGAFEKARHHLSHAMVCPGALGTPFIHLRLGQAQYELGNVDRAKDELARAYMGGGAEMFAEEDAKYLTFLRRHMRGV